MFQIYFCISAVILSVALSVGLISGVYFKPPEIYSNQEIYLFAGKVAIVVALLICGIIFLLSRIWHIRIEKSLIKEGQDEK